MGKAARLSSGVILAVSLMGCADDGWFGDDEVGDGIINPDYNGVYVLCRGHGQQWATWHPGWGQWMIMSADPLETCIGPPNIKGANDAPFTIDEWEHSTSSFPAYHDKIAKLCEAKCWNNNQNIPDGMGGWIENEHGVCSASGWPTHNTKEGWILNHGFNCVIDALPDVGTIGDPYAETINWGGGSSPLSLPLSCSLLDDCYTQFDGDIGKWTQAWEYGGELGPIVPMERGADYFATVSVATSLNLDMDGGSGPGHDDAGPLDGYAEYSASDCGEATCPFYLASFSAWNDADAWTISVTLPGVLSEEKHIANVQIDALHSSLGAWRPSTGQVAFLPGSLNFAISFDVSSDCTNCTGLGDDDYELVLRNHEVVFGRFSVGGFALEQTFPVVGGKAMLEVDLNVEEGPPHASIALSAREECNDERGYVLGPADNNSRDPDDDIESEMWLVDGVAVPNGTALEPGTYDLALGVVDSRGAWDFTDEREWEVIHGDACI